MNGGAELSMHDAAGPATPRHVPGDGSMWVFVIGDMVIFSAYFAAYLYDRSQGHGLFLESQRHLSQAFGVVNTLILLTSSLFVALGVQAARAGDARWGSRFVALGAACGAGFVVTKATEWSLKVTAGFTIGTNPFFMHYYMMTGVHFFHVLLGLLILGILWREFRRPAGARVSVLEIGATYWHMVDFLWIIIFALLYLAR